MSQEDLHFSSQHAPNAAGPISILVESVPLAVTVPHCLPVLGVSFPFPSSTLSFAPIAA